jgi:tRNA G10  N-methylase Trm11
MKYFLIFGKNKNLSLAEAVSLLRSRLKNPVLTDHGAFLIFETDQEITFWNEFGGSIKFGQIIGEVKDISGLSANIFIPHLDKEKKNFFGISFYRTTSKRPDIFKLGMTLKRDFEKSDIKIRLVTSKEETLSSVVVKTNKLLTRGLEAVILDAGEKLFIGKTLAVQEFSDYEFRDYGRPGRDTLSGMIPPKLAKMMLNISGAPKDAIILDPFCGSGTIITEAAILGYKNLTGTDISEKAIEDTNKNIEWVKNEYRRPETTYIIKQSDVHGIAKIITPNSIDAIITEPYLGPPLHGNEREDTIQKNITELSELYSAAFSELYKVAKKSAIMVIVIPFVNIREQKYYIKFEPRGWREEKIISGGKEVSPLIWSRPDQKVIREIRIYRKNSA